MHSGLVKLQNAPPGNNSHVCVLLPTSSKLAVQVYVTKLPSLVSVKLLLPLSGAPGSLQSTKTNQMYTRFILIMLLTSYIFQDREMVKENKLMYQKMLGSGFCGTELLQYQCQHFHSRQTARNDIHSKSSLYQNPL